MREHNSSGEEGKDSSPQIEEGGGESLFPSEGKDSSPQTPDQRGSIVPPIKEISLKKILKEKVSQIFNHWTSKNLVNHREISPHIRIQLEYKLNTYSVDELMEAITNYDLILNDPMYKLKTRWGLADFLERSHFEKFLNERDPFSFYPKNESSLAPKNESKFSRNKRLLLGGRLTGHEGGGSRVYPVQGGSSLPESD